MCDTQSCGPSNLATATTRVSRRQRRAFLKGMASLPLAAVLADPLLAQAAGNTLSPVSVPISNGKPARAFVAMPARTPAPCVLLIHEWWGLNDQIKAVAAEFARQGFIALAVDLYDGKVATTREDANADMRAMDPQRADRILSAWIAWLRKNPHSTGKVGTVGWCFGGGWSLNASLASPVDATVIYYGNVRKSAADLKSLKGPVLGHFGTLDHYINSQMVNGFVKAMHQAGKDRLTVHWYTANHAFANPSGARYDEADAKLAWSRTLKFFRKNLE